MIRFVSYLMAVCCVFSAFVGSANGSLVASYSFEDTISAPQDPVVNSATGSSWGGAVASSVVDSGVEGIVNNAFDFPGLAYVNTNNKLSATGDFTISGWVNIDQTSANAVMFGQYAGSQAGRMILYSSHDSSGSVARFGIWDGSGTDDVVLLGDNAIDDGNWHHLAVTRSSDTFTLYVDGVAEASATLAGVSLYQGNNLAVGNLTPSGSTNIITDGIIDEVAIYDNALTSTEVAALYQSIPEPATIAILALGGLLVSRKRHG